LASGAGSGNADVRGQLDGNVKEKGAGNLVIYRTARIGGDVSESGAGRIIRR
jgi:cytoskeletal protein CcmA (bactofilin family)